MLLNISVINSSRDVEQYNKHSLLVHGWNYSVCQNNNASPLLRATKYFDLTQAGDQF